MKWVVASSPVLWGDDLVKPVNNPDRVTTLSVFSCYSRGGSFGQGQPPKRNPDFLPDRKFLPARLSLKKPLLLYFEGRLYTNPILSALHLVKVEGIK